MQYADMIPANPTSQNPLTFLTSQRRRWFIVATIVISLFAGELVARVAYYELYGGQKDRLLRAFLGLESEYNPNMVSNYVPHPYLVYALNPDARYYYASYYGKTPQQFINSLGFRGKEFSKAKAAGVYRIVCIGGSTTFSINEPDETKTYPQLLEDALNANFDAPHFEVVNAGTPGWTTAESLINLHFRLLELNPDMIIDYEAVNDTFAMRMEDEGKSDYSNFRQIVDYKPATSFQQLLFRASAIYRLYYVSGHTMIFDINGLAAKPYPPEKKLLENLDKGTGKNFRRNMESIVAIAQSRDIQPVLVTMGHGPWHPSLMRLNQITRDVASVRGALLVDFEVTSQPDYFMEDVIHLTRAGNKALVHLLIENFANSRLPFHKRSTSEPLH
jgi:lysophospholipase L1-like esterase